MHFAIITHQPSLIIRHSFYSAQQRGIELPYFTLSDTELPLLRFHVVRVFGRHQRRQQRQLVEQLSLTYHQAIHQSSIASTYEHAPQAGPVECLCLHKVSFYSRQLDPGLPQSCRSYSINKTSDVLLPLSLSLSLSPLSSLGRLAYLFIIARKQHSAGRGRSATTTSPSFSSSSSSSSNSATNPSASTSLLPLPVPQHALSTITTTATNTTTTIAASAIPSGSILPVSLSLPSTDSATDTQSVSDLSAALGSSDAILPIIPTPVSSAAVSAAQSGLVPPTDNAIDAHDIQAQVEALIKSTSTSVVANATDAHHAITHSLPSPAPFPPSISSSSSSSAAAAATAAATIATTPHIIETNTQPARPAPVAHVEAAAAATTPLQAPALLHTPAAAVPVPVPVAGSMPTMGANNADTAMVDAAIAAGPSFQNTFAQYQFPQNHDRALKQAAHATLAEAGRLHESSPSSSSSGAADGAATTTTTTTTTKQEDVAIVMTKEEEERAADALIADIDGSDLVDASTPPIKQPEPFSGADLAAAAKAIGIEADADLLGGMSQDQRALAAAIKRLGDQHSEAAQKAIQQAAAAAAAATAAARASQELARAAAKEQSILNTGCGAFSSGNSSVVVGGGPFTPTSASVTPPTAAASNKSNLGPVKRFPCPKCDKAFARAYNLNTHLSTHDPDPNRSKPFACPYPSCKSEGGRSFSRKHDLQRHVASIHENEAEPGIHGDPEQVIGGDTGGLVSLGLGTPGKKFRCDNCGRSFVRRDACNRHQCDGKDTPTSPTSRSPSSTSITPYASLVSSPRSGTWYGGMMSGGGTGTGPSVTLPAVRSVGTTTNGYSMPVSMSRRSPVAAATGMGAGPSLSKHAGHAGGRPSSSNLSKEVQGIAKQLQARVEAQSPGPPPLSTPSAPLQQRNMASLPGGGERRNFPLSAISLYASTGTTPSSSSSVQSHSGSNSSSSNNNSNRISIGK
ncbi:uncharacterized protein UTRI_04407_B [Ustilago trichophora]|uniref:C2H2-type domain-containing protein n=1 Tax=Ustilago trichophora TaxID=86804 RepID=A0A5C3EC13_9BASI|nr:uncharacterized protein UTRI_04407_B [Ustilago trichophora]